MKNVIKSDLLSLVRAHKLVVCVLVISIACSFLVFSMMTGVFYYEISSAQKSSNNHTFSIDVGLVEPINLNGSIIKSLQNTKLHTAILVQKFSNSPTIAGWYGRNDNRWFVLDEGRFFSPSEMENDSSVAVVSEGLYPGIGFAEGLHSVSLYNSSVNIVGVGIIPTGEYLFVNMDLYHKYSGIKEKMWNHHDTARQTDDGLSDSECVNETIILPLPAFLSIGIKPDVLMLEYDIKTETELQSIYKELTSLFPRSTVYKPVLPEADFSAEMKSAIAKSVSIIVCAFINIIAMFVYLLSVLKRTHVVYVICGANKRTIAIISSVEWLVLMIFGYIIYIALCRIISPITDILSIQLVVDTKSNLLLFGFLYIITNAMLFPQIIKNSMHDIKVV